MFKFEDIDYDTLHKSIDKDGEKLKLVIAMEELAELQKICSKLYRGKNITYGNLFDGIADVLICLENLKLIYTIQDYEVEKVVKEKIDKENVRLEGGVNENEM